MKTIERSQMQNKHILGYSLILTSNVIKIRLQLDTGLFWLRNTRRDMIIFDNIDDAIDYMAEHGQFKKIPTDSRTVARWAYVNFKRVG